MTDVLLVEEPSRVDRRKGRACRRWSASDDQFLRENYHAMKMIRMAEYLGRTLDAVNRRICVLGIDRTKKRNLAGTADFEIAVLELYRKGWSDEEIAAELRCGSRAVFESRKRRGLEGWSKSLKRRLSAKYKRDKRFKEYLLKPRLAEHSGIVDQGWPYAWTQHEARILDLLEAGPKTQMEIGLALGQRETKEGYFVLEPLYRLLRKGIVRKKRIVDPSGRWFHLYRLGPRVGRQDPSSYVHTEKVNPQDYEYLVREVASRFVRDGRVVKDSDEYADGWMGLIRAAEKFRPEFRVKFTNYARRGIKMYILAEKKKGRQGTKEARVFQFSQVAVDDEGSPQEFGVSVDRLDDVADKEQCGRILDAVDERTRRLVQRVVMLGWTHEEAAEAEDPHLSVADVEDAVRAGLERMKSVAGVA